MRRAARENATIDTFKIQKLPSSNVSILGVVHSLVRPGRELLEIGVKRHVLQEPILILLDALIKWLQRAAVDTLLGIPMPAPTSQSLPFVQTFGSSLGE